jgi:hypothetical protein
LGEIVCFFNVDALSPSLHLIDPARHQPESPRPQVPQPREARLQESLRYHSKRPCLHRGPEREVRSQIQCTSHAILHEHTKIGQQLYCPCFAMHANMICHRTRLPAAAAIQEGQQAEPHVAPSSHELRAESTAMVTVQAHTSHPNVSPSISQQGERAPILPVEVAVPAHTTHAHVSPSVVHAQVPLLGPMNVTEHFTIELRVAAYVQASHHSLLTSRNQAFSPC